MERLTEEKQIGPFASLKDKAEAVPGAFGTYDCLYAHMVAVTRLKKYEDTDLEPEEILTGKELAEVACAMNLLKEYQAIGPIDHLRELAQAEKDGRLVVLMGGYPAIPVCDSDTTRNGFQTIEEAEAALKKREEVDNETD